MTDSIPPIKAPLSLLMGDLKPTLTQQWRLGEILEGQVTAVTAKTVEMLINQSKVTLNSDLPLSVGQNLQLQVKNLSSNPIEMQLLAVTLPIAAQINQVLRRELPKQESVKPLLDKLQALEKKEGLLPTALRQVLAAIPEQKTMSTAAGLMQSLQNSGLFFENKLLHLLQASLFKPDLLNTDWKNILLHLAQTLKLAVDPKVSFKLNDLSEETLNALLQDVNAALARLTVTQTQSLPQQINTTTPYTGPWFFELPVRAENGQIDYFQLQFSQEQTREGETLRPVWQVLLAFNFEKLGPIQVRVQLQANEVSTHWFAEKKQTQTLLQTEIENLKKDLQLEGIQLMTAEIEHGLLNTMTQSPIPKAGEDDAPHVLDVRI